MNRTAERTKESLPTFVLEPISYAELSPWAVKRFESYSWRFISPREYQEGNFSGLWKFSKNGVTVFIVRQEKKGYEMVYVYANRDCEIPSEKTDSVMGEAERSASERKGFSAPVETEFWGEIGDKSLENWKHGYLFFFGTNPEKWGRGIATEWLPFFDGLSRHFFKKPLTSGTSLCKIPDGNGGGVSPIARIFEKHVGNGMAKLVLDVSGRASYAFCRRISKILERKKAS